MKDFYKIVALVLIVVATRTSGFSQTEIQFSSASANVTEDGVSFDLVIEIANPDGVNATTADVVLTGGTATDIDNYTTQGINFAGGSSADETVTITITDDVAVESAEVFTFTLQNVAGGNAAVAGVQATFDLTIIDNDITSSDLIINEINADPAGSMATDLEGDANGDGTRDAADDEFIELVNSGLNDLDISGYEIFDTNSSLKSRHIFPANTIVPAGGAIVVFGGGSPTGTFGNSIVQTASSGSIGATNSSETYIIQDNSDNTIIYYSYGSEGGNNESITRDPDITGGVSPMTGHSAATGSGGTLFSPGTKIDGSPFIVPATTEVNFVSASASVNEADGTYDIVLSITAEDAINPTMVDVVLTSGSAADINNYTTQQVVFPAADASDQTVTLTITDDSDIEGDEILTFELQNISGGNAAIIGAQSTIDVTIVDNDFTPTDLVVNEFMPWPAGSTSPDTQFDANGDNTYGGNSDEYIELVNSGGGDLDISSWKINDGIDRHIFPVNTIIPAGGAIVVFGGGTPTGTFGNSIVQTASESSSLGMLNSGDALTIKDDTDATRLAFSYGAATRAVAFTRDPDITGDFAEHPAIPAYTNEDATDAKASPGLKIDGSFFIAPTFTEVNFTVASASVNEADGTYDIVLSIIAEDAINPTMVDVVLTSGSAADINNYTTQQVVFPAADASDQTVTLTITDDSDIEGDEILTFELQNISGGNAAIIGAQSTIDVTIVDNDFTPTDLVVNEFMPWPAGSDADAGGATRFDANGNGAFEFGFDEYIELVNSGGGDLDISGWKINDGTDRHIFPANTIIPAGGAIVVFGGDTPVGTFGNSVVQTASESTSLGLSNSGDEVFILDDTDAVRLSFSYGQSTRPVAFTRDPDITGDFVEHPAISAYTNEDATDAQASPGLKIDGSFFIEPTFTEVNFAAATASVNEGDGTYDVVLNIVGEDALNATTVDVVLTSGSAADINNYTTQQVVFPAADASDQTVTLTITDDGDIEGDEVLTFTLQNISGGNSAVIGAQSTIDLTIADNDFPPTDLVVNEFMPWPAGSDADAGGATRFDANGNGAFEFGFDEYIELVNSGGGDLDISGWKINDGTDRHIFPANTIIPAGGAIVVFGGDTPVGTFGNSIVQTASESTSLGLSNSGDEVFILDDTDAVRLSFSYGQSTRPVAFVRNPDITGDFEEHPATTAYTNEDGSDAQASPGLKADGSFFIEVSSTVVQFGSASASVGEADGTYDITLSILGEDASNATSVDVAIKSGDAIDINSYTTQTATFPAGTNENQVITLTITDDNEVEGDEVIEFELLNVSGGDNAELGSQTTFTLTIIDNDFPASDLILNEFLPYPSSTSITDPGEVDANGDGTFNGIDDEFIELVNSSTQDLDITGWKIFDSSDLRHVFGPTVLPAGGAVVVFSGGNPTGEFGGAIVVTASEGLLSLQNSGDEIIIKDNTDEIKFSFSYSATTIGVSYTRNPDITATDFSSHPDLGGKKISPGTKVDGTPFTVDNSTKVQFVSALGGAFETDATPFEIALEIINPDNDNETTADVVLTTVGAENDFSYTTQKVTFPAGSSDQQTISISILNDSDLEGDELFSFEIQNVEGGDHARKGINSTFNFFVLDDDVPLIFNEIHADPSSGLAGDANNDGIRDAMGDEFIEVINQSSETIDISGWEYYDSSEKRHVFENGTVLDPGRAVVVFGGGIPTGQFGGSYVQLASEATGLGLTNTGEAIKILNGSGVLVGGTVYGSDADNNQSITRSPDITGGYAIHTEAIGSEGKLYSPGTKTDGSLFINIVTGIQDQLREAVLYPNPVSKILYIQFGEQMSNIQFVLQNLNGQEVLHQKFSQTDLVKIDISKLGSGIYIYSLISTGKHINQKGKILVK